MIYRKNRLLYLFLGVEMLVYGYFYLYGRQGIQLLKELRIANQVFKEDLLNIEQDNNDLKKEIDRWKQDDFLKEKIARQELQMARKGEEIYYLTRH